MRRKDLGWSVALLEVYAVWAWFVMSKRRMPVRHVRLCRLGRTSVDRRLGGSHLSRLGGGRTFAGTTPRGGIRRVEGADAADARGERYKS